MRRPPVRIRLDDDLYDALRGYAVQRKLSMNQAGRQLISLGVQEMLDRLRLLSPGTSHKAADNSTDTAELTRSAENYKVFHNSHGYFARSDELWAGYFSTERMTRLSIAMIQALTYADDRDQAT